ncbi:MAG: two-component regulator propeller domain-containing protein [Balneolaceae bacterium]
MITRITSTIILCFVSITLSAQNLANQEFWYLTPNEGLSQSTVSVIFQDSEGFMWFGTLEGLNKYEGQNQNIVIYKHDPADTSSLSNDEVEIIFEDSRNNLWIGTDGGGLNLYNRDTENFTIYQAAEHPHTGKLSDNTVHTIVEDMEGNLLLGTFNGLNLMNSSTRTFENYFSDPKDPTTLSANYVTHIFKDANNNMWVGTVNGLNLFDEETTTFQQFYISEEENSGNTNYIEVVFEDSNNRLWVGTQNGLYIFDRESKQFISPVNQAIDPAIISASILSIFEDSQGVLWIGSENEGLFAHNIYTGENYYFKSNANQLNGLNSNSIYSLFESKDNIFWIGTFDGGLNILSRKRNKFTHYRHIPGKANTLNENSVYALLESKNGDIWIGTDGGGLNLFDKDNESFTAIRHDPKNPQGLPSDVIFSIIEDNQNRIWMGTYNGGLTCYNVEKKTFKTYKFDSDDPKSLSNNQVFVVFEDSEGYIWAGTNGGGINKLIDEEQGIFQRYLDSNISSNSLPLSYNRAIFEDGMGNLWIGNYGGGVVKFDPKSITVTEYNTLNNKISSNRVLSIYETDDGIIWAGTKGGGLARYNPAKDEFEAYSTKDGLPNDIVNAILEDDHGNLWLSTNNGLSKFNPETEGFKNFKLSDGVQSREFKPNAAFKDENGFMYFGGINGFNTFHPDSIREDSSVHPVAFTDFQLFNHSVPIGEESYLKKHINQAEQIILPYTESVITIKYSVLNYNPLLGYTYAYMLDGFDNDWNNVGDQNTATYTNLDPGNYTFKVKAANSDGYWGDESKQFALVITPPFWRTTWFYLLSAIAVIGLIVGGFRYRTRQITQLNKLLEREVNDRTSELQESNKDLKQALKELEETREVLVENAHKAGMADIATGVLHNIGNVLNSVNTSVSVSGEVLKKSKLQKLFKANELIREHKDNLEEFLTNDPKGQKLVEYFLKLDIALKNEFKLLEEHNQRLERKVHLINDVIAAQQSYASVGVREEEADIKIVLEDALTIFANSMEQLSITIQKTIEPTEQVYIQKTKLAHVILNILQNAKEALVESGISEKRISIKLHQQNDEVILQITDNGTGIRNEDLDKIFNHGFTTKKDGHGFGLHSSANYMSEMKGRIKVKNQENEQGVSFILSFPIHKKSSGEINTSPSSAGNS